MSLPLIGLAVEWKDRIGSWKGGVSGEIYSAYLVINPVVSFRSSRLPMGERTEE